MQRVEVTEAVGLARAVADAGAPRGGVLAIALADGIGVAVTDGERAWRCATARPELAVAEVEDVLRPRWVWWGRGVPDGLLARGVRVATCWDVTAVQRLLTGRWRIDPARIWATLHDLPWSTLPAVGQLDLLGASVDADEGDPEEPVGPDGHLRPEWAGGGWAATVERIGRWAEVTWEAHRLTGAWIDRLEDADVVHATRWAESTAELLAAELERDGLPIDVAAAEALMRSLVGARPASEADAEAARRARDAAVLEHAPLGGDHDLRNPAHVRSLLGRLGHRRARHPGVAARVRARPLAVHRCAPALAQGRAHRHDVRLRVARPPRRGGRAAARRVERRPTAPRGG